ncbi:extracellular solute-binding protein [Ahrensia marina]|uniref:extracellular solute-binding protein n=1 Tax=Ahrensia marina TaxID=1514904 RepID=UPI0006B66755|nr:extracellular solute-binding protein [Ahrensia marina]
MVSHSIKLKGITWDHPRGYDCVVAASEKYAELTAVEIEWSKRSLQAFADASIEALAEANDFIVLDHPHVGQISETGSLLPLPKREDASASLGGSAESYFWNDKCWSYAIDASCQMAVRRTDLGATTPIYWEDFLRDDAAKFRAVTPLLPVDAFDMLMTLVAGKGEVALPYSSDNFVSDDNGEYALSIMRALYNLGPAEASQWNPIKVMEVLSTTDEFACSPCLFGYINYARPGFRDKQLSYFDMPVSLGASARRAILGGAGIGVSSKTAHAEEAIKFAQWISSQDVQSGVYIENEGQPANRHTWLNLQNDPKYSGFLKGAFSTIDNAWTRPRDPWFLGFVDDACEIMPVFFEKNKSNSWCLDALNKAYRHHVGGK